VRSTYRCHQHRSAWCGNHCITVAHKLAFTFKDHDIQFALDIMAVHGQFLSGLERKADYREIFRLVDQFHDKPLIVKADSFKQIVTLHMCLHGSAGSGSWQNVLLQQTGICLYLNNSPCR
jgi:hypothetical protein